MLSTRRGLAEQLRDGDAHPLVDRRRHQDVGKEEFPGARRLEQADLGQGQGEGGGGPDRGITGYPGGQVQAARMAGTRLAAVELGL
jgi:hypothetical protein